MHVRRAVPADILAITEMSRRVQERLAASGSLQEFGPLPLPIVTAHVAAGTAHVLEDGDTMLGGAFIEHAAVPVTQELPRILERLNLTAHAPRLWWLQKLMVEPERQGERLGLALLEGVRQHIAGHAPALLALDCWAGNTKLRAFYASAGFRLHGEFGGGGDYDVAVFTWEAGESAPAPVQERGVRTR